METRYLPCKLTDKEKGSFAARNAVAVQDLRKIEDEKKSSASAYNELIKKKKLEVIVLSDCATTGIEYRDVTVYDMPDRVRGIMQTIRSDTSEVIATRHLNPREMQMSMDELIPERPPISTHHTDLDDLDE